MIALALWLGLGAQVVVLLFVIAPHGVEAVKAEDWETNARLSRVGIRLVYSILGTLAAAIFASIMGV